MQQQCKNYPLGDCTLPTVLQDTYATRKNNFRICLLTGCDGLEGDASCSRSRNNQSQPNNPICKLCLSEPEDHFHFIAKCLALSPVRSCLLSNVPAAIAPHLPCLETDPLHFTEVMLGLEWIKDTPTHTFTINFLAQLKNYCNSLTLQLN